MRKTFYFVDGIQADKTSKRLMRRHVMKGKNAGKRFHRPSKLGLQVAQRQPDINETTLSSRIYGDLNEVECRSNWRYVSPTTVARSCEKSFLIFSLPVEVPPASMKIINECEDKYVDSIFQRLC